MLMMRSNWWPTAIIFTITPRTCNKQL